MSQDSSPAFINPSIIKRLKEGTFVPTRQAKRSLRLRSDRRDTFSPLAIAKRSIRYDSRVFESRHHILLTLAQALNDENKKIILLGGPQGSGKTALLRGLVELMGSRHEQLLWFDVNPHTHFDEVIHFFLQYTTYLCHAFNVVSNPENEEEARQASEKSPIEALSELIEKIQDIPLLLVLDNIEYLITDHRFSSLPFKETLNFLLGFPNIKIILSGVDLPYADMSIEHNSVTHIQLEGLEKHVVQQQLGFTHQQSLELDIITQTTQKLPWLVNLVADLLSGDLQLSTLITQIKPLYEEAENQTNKAPQDKAPESKQNEKTISLYIGLILERLPETEKQLLSLLALCRHTLSTSALCELHQIAYPRIGLPNLSIKEVRKKLDQALCQALKRSGYPPQEALDNIKKRTEYHKNTSRQAAGSPKEPPSRAETFPIFPWHDLYTSVKQCMVREMSTKTKITLHEAMQSFYLREKGLPASKRTLELKGWILTQEAKYHTYCLQRLSENHDNSPAQSTQSPLIHHSHQRAATQENMLPASADAEQTDSDAEAFNSQDNRGQQQVSMSPLELETLLSSASVEQSSRLQQDRVIIVNAPSTSAPVTVVQHQIPSNKIITRQSHPTEEQLPLNTKTIEASPRANTFKLDMHAMCPQIHESDHWSLVTAALKKQNTAQLTEALLDIAQSRIDNMEYKLALLCFDGLESLEKQPHTNTDQLPSDRYSIRHIVLKGITLKHLYQHKAAIYLLEEGIERISNKKKPLLKNAIRLLADAKQNLGDILAYRGNSQAALELMVSALKKYQSLDDDSLTSETHFKIGMLHDDLSQFNGALHHYHKALSLQKNTNAVECAATTLFNIGGIYIEQNRPDQAINCYHQSLEYDIEAQNIDGQLKTLKTLSEFHLTNGDTDKGIRYARQGLTITKEHNNTLESAMLSVLVAEGEALKQQFHSAVEHYQQAVVLGQNELSLSSLKWITEKLHIAQKKLDKHLQQS